MFSAKIEALLGKPAVAPDFFKTDKPPVNYQTVVGEPHHDTASAEAKTDRAARLLANGKWEQGEQALQEALVADVTYGPAHNALGKHYYNLGKYYFAAWEFEYAVKLMPDRPEPINNLGLVYETVGKLDRAVEFYTSAYSFQPDNPELLGNMIRARMRTGDQSPELRQLLNDLLFIDTRPEWVGWAREQLALVKFNAVTPTIQNLPLEAQNLPVEAQNLPVEALPTPDGQLMPQPQAPDGFPAFPAPVGPF